MKSANCSWPVTARKGGKGELFLKKYVQRKMHKQVDAVAMSQL